MLILLHFGPIFLLQYMHLLDLPHSSFDLFPMFYFLILSTFNTFCDIYSIKSSLSDLFTNVEKTFLYLVSFAVVDGEGNEIFI